MSEAEGKRARGRPRTIDRERTVEMAMVTYWREGLGATSLNEMCRLVGISKPGLYREFGGEDGLMDAALQYYRELTIVPLLASFAADQPAARALERAIVALSAERATPAGCLFTKMRLAPAQLGPQSAARVHALVQQRREGFAAWFQRALDRGEANQELSPEFAAHFLDTQLTTVLVQRATGESPELVQAQARLALRGLVPSLGKSAD